MNISVDAYDVSMECPFPHPRVAGVVECKSPFDFPCYSHGRYGYQQMSVQEVLTYLCERIAELEAVDDT